MLGLGVFIIPTLKVQAIERNELIDSMNDLGRVVLLCEYADMAGTIKNEISYMFGGESITTCDPLNITYERFGNLIIGDSTHGTFERVFVKNNAVSYAFHNGHMSTSRENDFTCPAYSFIDYTGVNEICLADSDSCGLNFADKDEGPFTLTNNSTTIYNVMDNFIKNAYNQITFEEYKKSSTTVEELVKSKALAATKSKYEFDTRWKTPKFVTNYINNNYLLKDEFESLQSRMDSEANKVASSLTESEKKEIEKKNNITYKDLTGGGIVPPTGVDPDGDESCNSILGDDMSEIINNIFKTIQYAGPVLVIVLTALDMLKAITSGEQDQMKKATNKFTKRLIAAMLLFFVPLLCSLVFDIAAITVPDSCIGKLK